jgi:hypothetical protein
MRGAIPGRREDGGKNKPIRRAALFRKPLFEVIDKQVNLIEPTRPRKDRAPMTG